MARMMRIAFISVGLAALVGGVAFLGLTRENEAMKLTNGKLATRPIPPIDAAAPAKTETATFGLG